MSHPAITQNGAIVGARSVEQVERNVGAAEVYLSVEEIAEIEGRNIYELELVAAA